VPEAELPLRLPEVAEYEPSGTGESPLVKIKDWVEVRCPHCGGRAKRETNTMPQWAGSSWYYLRYIDPHNDQALIDPAKERYMMPVDFYVGGAEHATRHLIYARFWHKFLYDLGVVSTLEPFTKLQHVGLILAEDGRKMSKRWHNVINPDEIVAQYGADAMRVYEMFMAPFGAASAWNTQGLVGCRKFLDKVVLFGDFFQPGKGLAGSPGLDFKVVETKLAHCQTSDARDSRTLSRTLTPDYLPLLHQTIRKVTQDMAAFKLNTVVSALMILTNKMLEEKERVRRENVAVLLQLLAPVAPHLAEEMWERLGHKESIFCSKWPEYDEKLAQDKTVMVPVQINGKLRDQVEVAAEQVGEEEQVWELILAREKVRKYLAGKEIKKKIYVRGKIANLVIGE
jgi:leucyl-tRNA synthetase